MPVLVAGCLGAAVSYAVLGLIPPVRHEAGPATLEARLSPGWGDTVLQVPPLGTVSADSHATPIALRVSLVEVDVTTLARRVGDAAARAQLTTDVEADLRELAPRLLLQFCGGAALVGAATGALLPRRRPAFVVAGAAGALVLTGALLGGSAASYDVAAFEQPRFTGALVRAPVVIDALQGGEATFARLQSRYETAAERLSDLLALVAQPNRDPASDSVALLHVSDIHSNPLGVQLARELAVQFDVDAIVDTGDLTNFGLAAEARIGRLIDSIPVPYYLVPGNHDSARNEAQLDRIDNLTVLDGDVAEVEGIRVLGWGDPTDTNWNRISPDEAAEIRVAEGEDTAAAVAAAEPDVLAVHDKRLAEASFGNVPLVLAGHYHKRIEEEVDGTRVLSVGSTGATGLKFFVEAERDYEAEIVYFRGRDAIAVDYVRFSGLGSDFEIDRETFESDEPAEAEDDDAPPASELTGDFDGDGANDVLYMTGSGNRRGLRAVLGSGAFDTYPLTVDDFTRPQLVGVTDADGDGDDEAFVNVLDHVYHGGTTSVLALFAWRDGVLAPVVDDRKQPFELPVGGVSNFGEGVECRDVDADGTPEVQLLRIDSASSARSRWIEKVYRWRGAALELIETNRGTLRRRGFTDPRVYRFYELHCGRLDPAYPF